MNNKENMMLLVGDNPFHGISHLSQERARVRNKEVTQVDQAAHLISTSVDSGANGFMFSVSETTLSILKKLRNKGEIDRVKLYALVPYAYEYARLAIRLGGIAGLAEKIAKQIAVSGNVRAMAAGLKGVIRSDPVALMKMYLIYEVSRIRSSAGRHANLDSILLHEIITDMALALDLDWLFKSYLNFMSEFGLQPGFETRNFVYMVDKFRDWDIDCREIIIATPFNAIGFQMNPSKVECEKTLATLPKSNIIAMSALAAGYLQITQATNYIRNLSNLRGVVVGVSKEHHARETFKILKDNLS